MKHHIVIYFTANPLSDKILFLKLLVKMLMASHIENLLKCNISRKKCNRHQISLQEDTVLVYPHQNSIFRPGMPKVPKVTKLQNLRKKEVRHKFSFLHEDKNQSFLEADAIVFGGHNQVYPKYPKQQVFATFLQLLLNPWLIVEM